MEKTATHPFDRFMGWLLPAIVGLTPFFIIYLLVRPTTGQAFFFQGATLAALVALGVAWCLGWRSLPGWPTYLVWVVLLNGAAALASLSASLQWAFSLKQALLPICGFIFFGLMVSQPDRRRVLERIRAILVLVGVLLALYGILQHFGVELLRYGSQVEKNRVVATIGHPNYLASVLGPTLFLGLGLLLARPALAWKAAAAILAFLILLCLALAQTRGVWVGILMGLAATATLGARYCMRRGIGMRWLAGGAVGALVIGIGLTVVMFRVLPSYGRGVDMEQRVTSDKEIKSRLFYWRAAVDMAMQKKLFGQGYAMFDPRFWTYALEQQKSPMGPYYYDVLPAVTGRTPGHVHNEYLEVLAEEGFVGLAALVALLGFFVFFGYWAIMGQSDMRAALKGATVYGALVTILVDACFAFPWRLPVSLIVFVVVLALLYDLIYPQAPAPAAEN